MTAGPAQQRRDGRAHRREPQAARGTGGGDRRARRRRTAVCRGIDQSGDRSRSRRRGAGRRGAAAVPRRFAGAGLRRAASAARLARRPARPSRTCGARSCANRGGARPRIPLRGAAAAGGGRSASGAGRADRRRPVVLPRGGTAVLLSVQARADPRRSLRDPAAGARSGIASHRGANHCRRVRGARRGPAGIDRPPLERGRRCRARCRGMAQGGRCRPLAQCFCQGAGRLSARARPARADTAVAGNAMRASWSCCWPRAR